MHQLPTAFLLALAQANQSNIEQSAERFVDAILTDQSNADTYLEAYENLLQALSALQATALSDLQSQHALMLWIVY